MRPFLLPEFSAREPKPFSRQTTPTTQNTKHHATSYKTTRKENNMNTRTKTILLIVAFIAVIACIPASYYFGKTSGHRDVVNATSRELDNFNAIVIGQRYLKFEKDYSSLLTDKEREAMQRFGQARVSGAQAIQLDLDRSTFAINRLTKADPKISREYFACLTPQSTAVELQNNAKIYVIGGLIGKLNLGKE